MCVRGVYDSVYICMHALFINCFVMYFLCHFVLLLTAHIRYICIWYMEFTMCVYARCKV